MEDVLLHKHCEQSTPQAFALFKLCLRYGTRTGHNFASSSLLGSAFTGCCLARHQHIRYYSVRQKGVLSDQLDGKITSSEPLPGIKVLQTLVTDN